MLDQPARDATASVEPVRRPGRRWPAAFLACAGLMGAAGVGIAAAGDHLAGGDLARTSSSFLLVHAGAVAAGSCWALARPRGLALLAIGLVLLTGGAVLFSGELVAAALAEWHPVPLAAPVGGLCLIAGWVTLALAGLVASLSSA